MVPEAPMEEAPGGKKPVGEGWFVVNAREAQWIHNEALGAAVTFEGSRGLRIEPRFPELGFNIQVIWPGQPNGYQRSEVMRLRSVTASIRL